MNAWQVKATFATEQKQSQKLSTDLDQANSTIKQLRQSSDSMKDILQEELQSLRSSSQQLQIELASTKESLQTTEQRFTQSSAQLDAAQQGLVQSKAEVEEIQRSMATSQEAAAAATKEKQVLELSISSLGEDLEETKKAAAEGAESKAIQQEVRVIPYV